MMQPYFFPYLGYFALIADTDQWVVFDTAQYIRRGWVHRNRILSGGQAHWKYLRLPVRKAPQTAKICHMKLTNPEELPSSIARQLDEYRCWRPPFYEETMKLLDDCMYDASDDLTTLLVSCLQKTCAHLQIEFRPVLFSDLAMPQPACPHPGDWALTTACHLNAQEYVNPPGGRDLFNPVAFDQAGIRLSILEHRLPAYFQGQSKFTAGLSVIDALMWTGRDATRQFIDDYQLSEVRRPAA